MITVDPATRSRVGSRRHRSSGGRGGLAEAGSRSEATAPGDRRRRRLQRRRTAREQILVGLVLLVALVITVVILAMQWLENTPSTASSSPALALSLGSGGLL